MRAHGAGHRCRPSARQSATGHTLIELLLSVAIMAVLMGAMVISLAVASRALDDGAGPAGQTRRAAGIVEDMDADLAMALSFTERTAQAVTFTVPDRDGDGKPETIRYSWAGPDDGRLLRQVNGGPAVAIAQDVRHFGLTYQLKTIAASQDKDEKGKKHKKDKKDKKGKKDKDKDKKDKDKDKGGKKKGHH